MLGASVESLFARYRKKGDAGALAQVFDRTAPELFRLAQHLVRDPLEAEDVLQETFVAAIDAAERWDDDRPLVPWMTGILARKASEARRRSRRVIDPGRLQERTADDPADVAADSEFSRELRAALAELPPLYRDVLERHLLEGARPAEIAAELARAPGTVRMQLHRGLEQLRKSLPAGFAAGAALAALSPRGLSAVREAVLAHATSVAAAGGATVVVAAAQTASVIAWKLGLGGLAAVLLALAGTYAWRAGRTSPDTPLPAEAHSATAKSPDAVRIEALPPSDARTTLPPAPERPRTPLAVLSGRVLGPSAEQMSEVRLEVRGVARYEWPAGLVVRGTPAADGSFELALDPLLDHAARAGALDEFALSAEHPAYVPAREQRYPSQAEIVQGEDAATRVVLRADVTLHPALILRGVVRLSAGMEGPVHVAVLPVQDEVPQERILDQTVAAEDGSYVLRLSAPSDVQVLAAAAEGRPAMQRLYAAAGIDTLVDELVLDSGVRLEGRFNNGHGSLPFRDVVVSAALTNPESSMFSVRLGSRMLVWTSGTWQSNSTPYSLDASGRFVASGLELGSYFVVPQPAPQLAHWWMPQTAWQRIELVHPFESKEFELYVGQIGLRVLDADGRPCAGRIDFKVGSFAGQGNLDSDGHFVLAMTTGQRVVFSYGQAGQSSREIAVTAPAAGERVEEELRLGHAAPAPSASIRVTAPGGAALGPTINVVLLAAESGGTWDTRVLAVQDKRIELEGLPPGRLELELFAGGAHRHFQDFWLPARVQLEAQPGLRSQAEVQLQSGGRLRITARDAAGSGLPAECRLRDLYGLELDVRFLLRGPDEQGFAPGQRLSDKGPNDVYPNLPPGAYEVELSLPGHETRVLPVRIEAGQVSELEVVLP